MTREEAIKWLENLKSDIGKMQFRALWGYEQAMDEIIGLLSAKPSGDLISRQLIIGAIEKCGEEKIYPQALIETIQALPSADRHEYNLESIADIVKQLGHLDGCIADILDRPKGEWIFNAYEKTDKSWFICSKCGNSVFHKSNYCPYCGAKMKGGQDE